MIIGYHGTGGTLMNGDATSGFNRTASTASVYGVTRRVYETDDRNKS